MFEELAKLAKQIDEISVKLEEKIGPEVAVPWFERQMECLYEIKEDFKYAEEKLKEMETNK